MTVQNHTLSKPKEVLLSFHIFYSSWKLWIFISISWQVAISWERCICCSGSCAHFIFIWIFCIFCIFRSWETCGSLRISCSSCIFSPSLLCLLVFTLKGDSHETPSLPPLCDQTTTLHSILFIFVFSVAEI